MSTGDTHGPDEEAKGRMRVSRACTRCRSRKDKCDGLRPTCSTCRNANAPELCTYEPSTKKRGLPEGYVRGLEKLYSLLMSRLDGFEEVVVHLLSDEKDALTRVWNHKTYGDNLHQAWKESRILQQLEVLLAAVERPQASSTKRKRDDGGGDDDDDDDPTSISPLRISLSSSLRAPISSPREGRAGIPWKSSLGDVLSKRTHSVAALDGASAPTRSQQSQQGEQRHQSQQGEQRHQSHQSRQSQQSQQTPASASASASTGLLDKTFKLPEGASESINAYFSSVHCWLPMLDKGDMYKICFELSRGEVPVDASNDALAKLSAALTLSSLQFSMGAQAERALDVSYLYEVSIHCIPLREGLYTLGHVQALVLLVLADISSNRWSVAWLTIGLAARVIQDLIPPTKPLVREESATYQACFILDTLVAFRLRRMPQLRRSQLPVYLIEDGHDEWGPIAAASGQAAASSEPGFLLSTFNRVTDLFAMLNDRICMPPGNTLTSGLGRFSSLSHSHNPADHLPTTPHKVALKAIQSAMGSYFEDMGGAFDSKAFHTLNVASTWLKQLPSHTSSIIATATVETIRHRVRASSVGASSSNSPSMINSLGSWPADPFVQDARCSPSQQHQQQHQQHQHPHQQHQHQHQHTPSTGTPAALSAHSDNNLTQVGNANPAVGMAFNHAPLPVLHHSSATITYNPAIPPSPSYHGSEIDALFHEVAQLDTMEWAEGRNQGLKDFGFADAMAFEAFCNDPNRLFSSYQQPNLPNQSSSGIPPMSQEQQPNAGSQNVTEMWIG